MGDGLVYLNDDNLLRIASRELMNKLLKVFAIQVVELLKVTVARQRFDQTIQPEGGTPPLIAPFGFHASQCNDAPAQSQ